jgi:hypothetical protein
MIRTGAVWLRFPYVSIHFIFGSNDDQTRMRVISLRFHMLAIPLSPPAPARRRDETHRRCRRRHRRALRGTRAPQHILAVTYFMIRADN